VADFGCITVPSYLLYSSSFTQSEFNDVSKYLDAWMTFWPGLTRVFLVQGKVAAAQLLLEHGAVVHVRNKLGRTPLHVTISNENPDMTRLLLEHDADVEAEDNDHVTTLHLAARNGKREFIQVLLNYGANVHARDKRSQTPFDVASTEEVMKLLRRHELREAKNTS